jgi:serine/threonine-protein kinase
MSDFTRLTAAVADRYRLERELGAGGMATVYLAHDIRHDRKVALKVLRPELAAILGPERFLNEIRITAHLDHPHILTLIDSGAAHGFLYYVLPFVRGESLRDQLKRERQLGIDQALAITRQVASAVDYAHRQGVIHRDIKPENILLQEGEAMLADFGIALAVKEAAGRRLTATGISLGTPEYMSPEQAMGDRQPDVRSDVYSLGAVVYEMLVGEPPAKRLTERPPPIRTVRETVPEGVDHAVARALARTPADRFASAGDFAAALHQGLEVRAPVVPTGGWRPGWRVLSGALAVATLAFVVWRVWLAPAPVPTVGRSEQLTAEPGLEIQPAISPDGRFVAYSAGTATRMRIFVRPVGGGRTIPLTDDSTAVQIQPRWSPDGTSVLFLARGGASVAPAFGGTPRAIAPRAGSAAWSPDGKAIAIVHRDSLLVISPAGGNERYVGPGGGHSCVWSPDGRWIACVRGGFNTVTVNPGSHTFGNLAPSDIVLLSSAGGVPVPLVEQRTFNQSPVWSPDGRQLLFVSSRDGPRDVYALTIGSSGRARGEPRRLTTGLGAISISLSADGERLAYAVYSARSNIWSLPIPAGDAVTADAAAPVTTENQVIESMRVSRDGRWLLYDSDLRGNADVYRIPVGGGAVEQLTSGPADEFAPDLSPDGRAVAYHSWRTGTRDIEVKPLDGGPIEYVTATPAHESYPVWSPDGRAIVFCDQRIPYALFVTRREGNGRWSAPSRLVEGIGHDWSPDGLSIAFAGGPDIYTGPVMVVPAAGGEGRRLVVPALGALPAAQVVWSPDGRMVYYKAHDAEGHATLWGVAATGGAPRLLVRFEDPERQSSRRDFATDGRRFYFAIEDRQSDVWVAELLRR